MKRSSRKIILSGNEKNMEMKKHNDMQKHAMESYNDLQKHATCKNMQHAKTCHIKKTCKIYKKKKHIYF